MTLTTLNTPVPLAGAGRASGAAGPIARLRSLLALHASRRALAGLDDRLLGDIGISREQALREANKPLWVL